MLKLRELRLAAVMGLPLAFGAAGANAAVYNYDVTSPELTAAGTFTVEGNEITGITGTLSGAALNGLDQTINALTPNPAFSSPSISPDGAFIYDNLFLAGNPHLDVDGVLFTTAQNPGGYWNLWGNGTGSYSLWESVPGGGYPIQESSENLTVSAVPESPTWIMTLLGFAGLGFAGYRRARNSRVALCAASSIA